MKTHINTRRFKNNVVLQQENIAWIIFVIKQFINKRLPVKQVKHFLFIDLGKFFDKVPLKFLWKTLKLTGMNVTFTNAIKYVIWRFKLVKIYLKAL